MGTAITTLAQLMAKIEGGYGLRARNTLPARELAMVELGTSRRVALPAGNPGAWVELGDWLTAPDIAVSYEIRRWLLAGWIELEISDEPLALTAACSHIAEVVCAYDGETNPKRYATLGGDCRGLRILAVSADGAKLKTHGAGAGTADDYYISAAEGVELPVAGADFIDVYFGPMPNEGDYVVFGKYLTGDPILTA